jgi:hypothetical protein
MLDERLRVILIIWLTGQPALIEARILRESRYAEVDAEGGRLIEKFVARSQGYNAKMVEAVSRLGLPSVAVTPKATVGELVEQCLARMRPLG